MSFIYSQALVEAFSEANCSGTDAFAQLSESLTHKPSWWHDKTMEPSRHSRFGMTYAPLTESLGAELLMWFVADSLAKISALPETGPDWTAKGQGYGEKWRGLLGKYDHATHSLKTAQLSLLEDSTGCCPTLPRWGLMLDGELYPQPMLEPSTVENESGFSLPTPCATDAGSGRFNTSVGSNKPRPTLAMMAKRSLWPTPQASDNRDRGNASTPAIKRRIENGKQVMLSMCVSSENGRLNPDWVELLMGWPLGMTSLEPIKKEEINGWKVGFAFKGLQDMRKNIQSKTIQRTAGGCDGVHEPGALQQNMRKQQRINKASIASLESKKAQEGEMRGVRIHEESCSSSLRPGSNEQRPEQPSDSLQAMPRLLALYRKAPWEAGSWEDGVPRVANGVANRANRIKAIGNGQVSRVAAAAFALLHGE